MYKLYIGYNTYNTTLDNQGWSAEVSGFTSINEAINWANFKIINQSKVKHFWFWIYECKTFEQKLVYINKNLNNIDKVEKINDNHLTIKEYGKIEKKSLFPKLINWSPTEGIKTFDNFINKLSMAWKNLTNKNIDEEND